ncbi:MAG: sigma-70 family RNA polymerase sigma factor [Verrucomicrobiota bacterium]
MSGQFPTTPFTLLTRLREPGDGHYWQVSWKRFLELYHEPLAVTARACYRHHSGGHDPSPDFTEDIVATVVADFFTKSQYRYDADKGRLRNYLRVLTNARVVDLLRKVRPAEQALAQAPELVSMPVEAGDERDAFHSSLLATLVEDLRNQIPLRQFEIFEMVKLKHQAPESIAAELGIRRAAVDRSVHKTMTKLREIARRSEYQEEFYP